MGGDDFLVTDSNREAAAWIGKWPDWPAHGLALTGSGGSGKTHLLNLWLAKSNGLLVTQSQLIEQNSVALTVGTPNIAIDNADKIAGDAAAEEALFHLYNHLKSSQGSLLLAMQKPVGQAGFVLPDLRSRLLTLPAANLGAPDDALLAALIVKQFRDRQIDLDAGVVAYLTPRMPREAVSARDLVEKLDKASLAEGRKITIALTRRILEESDG